MKPCAYYDWDEAAARDRLTTPVDTCAMQCGTCGFNPKVADRRIEKVRREWQKNKSLNKKIFVIISNGKRKDTLETWRYWEIVGALQWMGADRQTAYDAAKWAMKAKPGDSLTVGEISMEVKDA